MTEIPTSMPDIVTKGDTCKFKVWLEDYKPEDGWVLTYSFKTAGSAVVDIAATDNGDGYHLVNTTITCVAGVHKYQGRVTDGTDTYTVARGEITVKASLADADDAFDGRGTWTQFLEKVEDAITSMSSGEIKSGSISHNQREYQFRNMNELKTLLSMAESRANREKQLEALEMGKVAGNRIKLRF